MFSPQHQVLAAAGITVFAPEHPRLVRLRPGLRPRRRPVRPLRRDRRRRRLRARAGRRRRAPTRRGSRSPAAPTAATLTLLALVGYPTSFAAGVDICGMSDLLTFYRDTEPWIAAAAVTKYGDPVHDRALLAGAVAAAPRRARSTAPLLVVHGELDTNVPAGRGARRSSPRCAPLGRPVEYLRARRRGPRVPARDVSPELTHPVSSAWSCTSPEQLGSVASAGA